MWTPPKTWVNDEPLTAADLNAHLSDNLSFLANLLSSFTLLRDEQSSSVSGGSFTSGAWRTRTLNTFYGDPEGDISLNSNQFTLQPGTYVIVAEAVAAEVNNHRLRLQNITANTTAAIGLNCYASAADLAQTTASVWARLTLTQPTTFELQHLCQTSKSSTGFGRGTGMGIEVYAQVALWRLA